MTIRIGSGYRAAGQNGCKDTLNSIAAELNIGRSELIDAVLREWLETNAYLPVRNFYQIRVFEAL